MAYNHGKEERKWRIWKEVEEKIMRKCGVDESVIEKIRTYDRADFNSTRRFYTHSQEVGTYLEDIAANEQHLEVNTITDLLDEIENESLYRVLLTVDKRYSANCPAENARIFHQGECLTCRFNNGCCLCKIRPSAEKAKAILSVKEKILLPHGLKGERTKTPHPFFELEGKIMALPKRSYWLREIETEEGTSYHISFRDLQGKIQELNVPYDFYMAFRRLELDERKLENWDYRHREFSEIYDESLNRRVLKPSKDVDAFIIEKEQAELLYKLIVALPETQRRRFLLYYEYDYNYSEIGAMEHCNSTAVYQSIVRAREKIKTQMKNYLCA